MDDNEKKNELLNSFSKMELYPSIVEEDISIERYQKISLVSLAAIGTSFEQLALAFQNVMNDAPTGKMLCYVEIPNKGHLAKFKDGSGYLGAVLKENGSVGGGQAVINPLVCNPAVLMIAFSIMSIDKKLENILEIQKEILDFLVRQQRSELKGDLNFLSDVFNNYKHNWNSVKFKDSNYTKVLDIRQSAERKIDFYKEQIMIRIKKKLVLHGDKEVNKQLTKLITDLKDYQVALYIYSFARFLEVILLENFDEAYLDQITNKIYDYSFKYREIYTLCYDKIQNYADSSVNANLLKGFGNINKVLGETIAKVPVINTLQIDEVLIETGDKIKNYSYKKANKGIEKLIENQSIYVVPFVENIKEINKLYNRQLEILFDHENIYLKSLEE